MKKIIYILPFLLVFFVCVQAKAASGGVIGDILQGDANDTKVDEYTPNLNPTSDKDDIGRRINGSWVYKYRQLTDGYFKNIDVAECVSFSADEDGAYMYIVKTPEGKLPNGGYTYDSYSLYGSGTVTFSAYQYSYGGRENDGYQGDGFWLNGRVFTLSDYSPGTGANTLGVTFVSPDVYENQRFITSLPIFKADDMDSINAYIQNGDISGAENSAELSNYDENIEIPRNLKVTGGYADGLGVKSTPYAITENVVLTWSQTVDTTGYFYETDFKFSIEMLDGQKFTGIEYTTGWEPYHENIGYNQAQQITATGLSEELEQIFFPSMSTVYMSSTGKKLPYKGYVISHIYVRVRNLKEASCSNYVVVDINRRGSSVTATVQDESGDTVENDEYNGGDVYEPDSGGDGDLSGFQILIDFVRSGFGLLGSNGLISLFQRFFSFMPDSFWIICNAGITLIIIIGVINIVLRR